MDAIETDYLVIGAGAAGMAFVDALIAASDAEVVPVTGARAATGTDAYPVRAPARRRPCMASTPGGQG